MSAVWADGLLLASGFSPDALVPALRVYHDMREQMAVGQYLDVGTPEAGFLAGVELFAALPDAAG